MLRSFTKPRYLWRLYTIKEWRDPGIVAENAARDLVDKIIPQTQHWVDKINQESFGSFNTSKVRPITLKFHPIKELNKILRIAAQNNDLEIIKRLILNERLDPSYRIHYLANVIHIAAIQGNTEIVNFLIENGALIDECYGNVKSFWNYRDQINEEYEEKKGPSPLLLATIFQNIEVIKTLINYGADVNKQANLSVLSDPEFYHYSNIAPLHYAATYGDINLVEMLLNEGAFVDIQNAFGETPLLFAVWKEHEEIVERLLELKANPKIESNWNCPIWELTENQKIRKLLYSATHE